jgi:hypothetical protein
LRVTFPAPVPEIPAATVDKAAAYYVNMLGFTFDWGDEQGALPANRPKEGRGAADLTFTARAC